jgi:hypothetical protein
MSAAILDQRRNPIGISQGVGNPKGIGRKYRECCIGDSYAESFGASYALRPAAYKLALPTTSQHNQTVKARRQVVPRAISSVSQTRVWNLLIDGG